MPTDLTVTVSDAQLKVLRQLDASLTAKQVLQTHVDTWLKPYVDQQSESDRKTVLAAYMNATPQVQTQVRTSLGLP